MRSSPQAELRFIGPALPVGWRSELTVEGLDSVISSHRAKWGRHGDWQTVLLGLKIVRRMLQGDRAMQGRPKGED